MTMAETALWLILWFSFLTALSGAMSPGPLLTYTVVESIHRKKNGYLVGIWVILGHAILEFGIIFLLLKGFSLLLQKRIVVLAIGLTGGALLIFMGSTMLRDIVKNRISVSFLPKENGSEFEEEKQIKSKNSNEDQLSNANEVVGETSDNLNASILNTKQKMLSHPVLGGILVSASNPYWWVWWATVGFAFMIKYDVAFSNWNILFFFIGHEMGDLVWYFLVSIMVHYGKNYMNKKVYYSVLGVCAFFMIGFGIFLSVSLF